MDGDGDLDVLASFQQDDLVAWYENANASGNGTTWTAHSIATGVDGALSAIAADVDGDGDLDALAVSGEDGFVAWYQNVLGDGTSWASNSISSTPSGPRSLFAADVDGDGKHTISELVELTNADPRRGIGHEKVLTRIQVDEESTSYAAEQGYGLDGVPPRGTRVFLKRTGNMSTGGISIDRTEEIHPENAEIAEQAAKVVGLDIAGPMIALARERNRYPNLRFLHGDMASLPLADGSADLVTGSYALRNAPELRAAEPTVSQ